MSHPPRALIHLPMVSKKAKRMCLKEHIDSDVLLRIFLADVTKSGTKLTSKVVNNVIKAKYKICLKDRLWLLDMLNNDEYSFLKFFYRQAVMGRKRIGRVTMEKFISNNVTRH